MRKVIGGITAVAAAALISLGLAAPASAAVPVFVSHHATQAGCDNAGRNWVRVQYQQGRAVAAYSCSYNRSSQRYYLWGFVER